MKHTVKVGDLFKCSWGYDQTNIDYYQVTKLLGQTMVEIRPIAQTGTQDGWLQGTCSPAKDKFIGGPIRKKVGDRNVLRMTSYSWAYPCSEKDESRWSSYA